MDNLAAALQRVHRIKGAGGSLGFAAVSHAAAQLESDLRALDEAAGEGGVEIAPMLQSLAQLKKLAEAVRPEASTLYGIDLSQVVMTGRRFAHGG